MVTNAWADRIEAVQTDFGDGSFFYAITLFNFFHGWASASLAHACGRACPSPLQNSKGNPLRGGSVKYKGWEIFANIALYLGKGTR